MKSKSVLTLALRRPCRCLLAVWIVLLALNSQLSTLFAQGTAFTYQGRLQHGGSPANGFYELSFALHDAVTNGNVVGLPVTVAPVPVSNGLFAAMLDFGAAAFTGADRWLEISVTVFGSDQPVVTLVPRQALTPAPYALHAYNAAGLMSFTSAPLDIKVNGVRALRLEPTPSLPNFDGAPNVIGGSEVNGVSAGVLGATIGGGGAMSLSGIPYTNSVAANFGTIGGGLQNTIQEGAVGSTLGGGERNTVQSNADLATISGGFDNTVRSYAARSTIGGGVHNTVHDHATYSTIGGGQLNVSGANHSTIGGGYHNSAGEFATAGGGGLNRATGFAAVVAGGGGTTFNDGDPDYGNSASGAWSAILGGANNATDGPFSAVSGGQQNAIGYDSSHAAIGGGLTNQIGAAFAVIGGGSGNRIERNSIADGVPPADYAVIGGGLNNTVQGAGSTIGGGGFNTIEIGEDESAGNCVIGGGAHNRAIGDLITIAGGSANQASSVGASIGGGGNHLADGWYSFIGGGFFNQASGDYAVVPGGLWNQARGGHSFATGRRARALHLGAFVWSDASGHDPSQTYTFDSATTNEFAVRATGGVRFVTAIETNGSNIAGVTLAPGSGAWSSLSDRHAKENFTAANGREILDKVAALPLASWNYKAQGTGVRHLGPMAQDFHAAFGLGESDRTITTVDADGVALAAIQGLNQKIEEQAIALRGKEAEIAELNRAVAELRATVEKISLPITDQPAPRIRP